MIAEISMRELLLLLAMLLGMIALRLWGLKAFWAVAYLAVHALAVVGVWWANPLGYPQCVRCGGIHPCDCLATINQSIAAMSEEERPCSS